jgi:hypothetical protein
MVDQELKEKMISRLVNWKFSQATNYIQIFERKDSIKCLELLEKLWGDTGWERGDTIFGEIITMLVEFIRMKEGWTTNEFYDEDQLIDVI